MAVYNGAAYVADAVESILRQTFGDFEFIIVDDGSTDDTGEVLARISTRDPRVHVLSLPHRGYVEAVNAGCAIARGELIARLDGDDLAEPGRLERQVDFLDRHPDVAVVGGAMLLITEDGRPFYIASFPEEPADVRRALAWRTPLAHPTVLMRRAVFERVGGYRTAFTHAEDYDLWLRIAREHELANLPDLLGRYRIHADNTSHRNIGRQAASVAAARAVGVEMAESGVGGVPRAETVLEDLAVAPEEVAAVAVELALWWAEIATRAGARHDGLARASWKQALSAAAGTANPEATARRVLRRRAQIEAEQGRVGRSRMTHARYHSRRLLRRRDR